MACCIDKNFHIVMSCRIDKNYHIVMASCIDKNFLILYERIAMFVYCHKITFLGVSFQQNRVFPGGKERPGRDADPHPLLVPLVMKE